MRSLARRAALGALTLAFAAAPLAVRAQAADARPTVAVMYFSNNSFGKDAKDYDLLGRGVADFLITDLSANTGIRVVERDALDKLTREQDLGQTARVDQETAVRVGKLLGARYMIFGGFIADPRGNVRLDSRAVEVETGRIVYVATVNDKADNFVPLIGKLAETMNRGMKLPDIPKRTSDARPAGTAAPASNAAAEPEQKVPFRAVLLYSRGVAAEGKGDSKGAVELYRQSLAAFPEFSKAKTALRKIETTNASTGE